VTAGATRLVSGSSNNWLVTAALAVADGRDYILVSTGFVFNSFSSAKLPKVCKTMRSIRGATFSISLPFILVLEYIPF